MKILADENLARDFVSWLRSIGHDVLYAAEVGPGDPDVSWVSRASGEDRLLVTSDKDFGELVFRDGLSSSGVVFLRLERLAVRDALVRLQETWSVVEANPTGKFIVITQKKIRVRDLAADDDEDS
jgi:predicted nuclease of predicted toxin-antitoxin system